MIVLAIACVAIGLMPAFFWPAMARAASTWNPAWTDVSAPGSLSMLGTFNIALAFVAVVGASLLLRRTQQTGLRRALTWDCGYVAPSPRMQYTAGSFASIITEWFAWILKPQRHEHRPVEIFPAHAAFAEHTPETVLAFIVEPASEFVMHVSTVVRRLQHGRLQSYLLYLVVGIAALACLVMTGEWQ